MLYVKRDDAIAWLRKHSTTGKDGSTFTYTLDRPIAELNVVPNMFDDVGICDVPPVVGKDSRRVQPGETVFGEDGREWVVDGIGGEKYDVVGHELGRDLNHMQPLKAKWLTHERPPMTRRQAAETLRKIVANRRFVTDDTFDKSVRDVIRELERGDD